MSFLKCLFPLFILFPSCVSVQQMHSATVLDEGESQTMISASVLDSSYFDYSDYPDNKLTTVLQISQRYGFGDYLEAGWYAYLPMINEAKYAVAPNLLGGDFKVQVVDKQNFALAFDFGLTLYSITSMLPVDYGIIASSNEMYGSVYIHLHGEKKPIFTTTMGYQGKHIVYEIRLPFIAGETGKYSTLYPIVSFGIKR
ncbi:MAG: hypothetical protein HRU38_16995 [Saccharospirillaceae bacterium]|nr:hypothetical protein [Pseudomonadales bacterium]NRB80335.1 hypothetical protein [Saccharospirillaceae bacterium]